MDFQTIVVIVLVVVIDVIAFLEYYKYKVRLDEAIRKRTFSQSSTQQSAVERIKQSIQTPLIVVDNGSTSNSQSNVKTVDSDVEKLRNENVVLQRKSDLASLKAKKIIQTSLNEVGGKIDGVLSQVQNVKEKVNSTRLS